MRFEDNYGRQGTNTIEPRSRCFKAYDLRGRIPDELNEDVAYRVGRGYAQFLQPRRVVVGRDIRLSSAGAHRCAVPRARPTAASMSYDIGVCGTEGVYFATFDGGYDGGIMVTASHNPPDYNGMKFVREQSQADQRRQRPEGHPRLRRARRVPAAGARAACARALDTSAAYVAHLLVLRRCREAQAARRSSSMPATAAPGSSSISSSRICRSSSSRCTTSPTAASRTASRTRCSRRIAPRPSRRSARSGADLGIAWDGDFDRCFLFDEHGGFIEGYYIVGLLASALLRGEPGGKRRARSAPDLEHASRSSQAAGGTRGAVQVRPCLHQAAHARGRRASTAAR